ncbi:MAG TPA: DNA-binding domain-containing protein, partial [Steroidobacteraceae bacterium]
MRELQRQFARALQPRPAAAIDADVFTAPRQPSASARLEVYRNNARQFFRGALELTFPVVQRRVGADYFRALAEEYREAHPSRRGDLHWAGEAFPDWLAGRLANTGYAWLGDLARLEWLCEEAMASGNAPALPLASLVTAAAQPLDALRVVFQPSLRQLRSRYPVWTVWQANQDDSAGAPVDLDRGEEHCAIACSDERVTVYRLDPEEFLLLDALAAGDTLGEALQRADA